MASKKLPRLSKSLLEKPQLITLEKFQEIAEVLDKREYLTKPQLFWDDEDDICSEKEMEHEDTPWGTLYVEGPLTYKPTGWEAMCGGASYAGLIEQMESFIKQGKQCVVMWLNTPGGQAYRMMYTARKLRQMADEAGIKLIGYIDGQACSAGMGLSSACHEVISNIESDVGSVGVVVSLMNDSKHLEQEGYERKFITAGEFKVPIDDQGEFKEGFLSDLQAQVNDLYDKFVTHIAEMRGIDKQVIIDTQARVFKAEVGLDIGLVDKIMEEDEFYNYLQTDILGSSVTGVENDSERLSNDNNDKGKQMSNTVDVSPEMQAQLAELAAVKAQLEEYKTKEAQAKKEKLDAKLSTFEFVADKKEALMSFFMNASVDEQHKELLSSVLDSAKLSINDVTEEAATQIVDLNAKLEAAQAEATSAKEEAEKVKLEFGTKQDTVELEAKDEVHADASAARTSQLQKFVNKKLASK